MKTNGDNLSGKVTLKVMLLSQLGELNSEYLSPGVLLMSEELVACVVLWWGQAARPRPQLVVVGSFHMVEHLATVQLVIHSH